MLQQPVLYYALSLLIPGALHWTTRALGHVMWLSAHGPPRTEQQCRTQPRWTQVLVFMTLQAALVVGTTVQDALLAWYAYITLLLVYSLLCAAVVLVGVMRKAWHVLLLPVAELMQLCPHTIVRIASTWVFTIFAMLTTPLNKA